MRGSPSHAPSAIAWSGSVPAAFRISTAGPFGSTRMTLLLVSNRLPVSVSRGKDRIRIQVNPGGVASGLGSFYREYGARWLGWPGDVPKDGPTDVAARLREADCLPVFLPPRLARAYYGGFCNGTLWPLLHSFPMFARYSGEDWAAYRKANELFADRILEETGSEDTLWVHDYHLMLVPELVRRRRPEARIGFFLHTPFPSLDVLRLLPWHRSIVEGGLGADLIGFQTYEDEQAFLTAVRRLIGLDHEIGRIVRGRRIVQVDVFPIGIDFPRFAETRDDLVDRIAGRFRRSVRDSKLVFSISRLDYTKGIPEQLRSYDRFLETRTDWRGRVQYLLCVVPSRERAPRYRELKRQIDELVGRINSRYGSLGWTPIQYVYRQLPFHELVALYRTADVALITPLKDGMNLVAKEYVGARADERGVLILSEMAGASKELLEALIVNPNDTDEIANAVHEAVSMPEADQVRRNRAMRARLQSNDVRAWASRFLDRLHETVRLSEDFAVNRMTGSAQQAIRRAYASAARRLILLDYDGTLVDFSEDPRSAVPGDRLHKLLATLASAPGNRLVVISGRTRADLETFFRDLPITLIAEHGAWVRELPERVWKPTVASDPSWKARIRPLLDLFAARVPGSSIEEKDFSLAWHYRGADATTGTAVARELTDTLTHLTANLDIQVLLGHRVVEILSGGANKGAYFRSRLADEPWEFLLAAGDDWTDEALFAALPKSAYSIRVGQALSAARYNVDGHEDVLRLLEVLVETLTR